jgi:hypothetical protein
LEKINGVILIGNEEMSMKTSLFKWLGMRRIYLIKMLMLESDFNLTQSSSSTFYGDLVGGFSFVKGGSGTITLSGARGAAETVNAGGIN